LTPQAGFLTIAAMTNPDAAAGSVPGAYVGLLFEYLALRGVDAAAVLGEAAGSDPAYPVRRWRAMLEAAATHLSEPALGLLVGARITPAHLGPLGYVLLASSSVPAAMERYVRYQRLVHDVSPVRSYLDGALVILEWSAESRTVGLLVNQCGMAAVVQFARDITGQEIVPDSVDFVEPAPAEDGGSGADPLAPYAKLFRCPVRFAADATRIRFPVSLLSLPLRRPDPALVAMLEAQVERSLAALPDKNELLQELRQRICRHLISGEPTLDSIADEMHISTRTMRRKLEAAGWSFRELLDDIRRQLAMDYLRDHRLALPEIALLLAYSEQSAFNRAFLRWTGVSPRRWRLASR
jgi:AraC-like DNA-binding protein